jgi:hypothetical protein
VNKFVLDFGCTNTTNACKLNETKTEELVIKNKGKDNINYSIDVNNMSTADYTISITPSVGEVKKVMLSSTMKPTLDRT